MKNKRIQTNEVIDYLFKAEVRWVVLDCEENPLCWKDGNVKVYSSLDEIEAEYGDNLKFNFIMTEFAFINKMLEEHHSFSNYLEEKI